MQITLIARPFKHWESGLLALCFISLLFVGFGCGPSGPRTFRVTGLVTWKGEPVPEGDIIFTPVDGKTPPAASKVTAGKYELRTTAGPKKVEVHATREEGPVDPAMGAVPRVPYIPSKYNAETTLTADVQANDANTFDFPLSE